MSQNTLIDDVWIVTTNQKNKLSFDEICPRWSKIIHRVLKTEKSRFRQDHKNLNISDCRKCIVGEAYGFDASYWATCGKCRDYSCGFTSILTENPSVRRTSIDRFVNHFNKAHL